MKDMPVDDRSPHEYIPESILKIKEKTQARLDTLRAGIAKKDKDKERNAGVNTQPVEFIADRGIASALAMLPSNSDGPTPTYETVLSDVAQLRTEEEVAEKKAARDIMLAKLIEENMALKAKLVASQGARKPVDTSNIPVIPEIPDTPGIIGPRSESEENLLKAQQKVAELKQQREVLMQTKGMDATEVKQITLVLEEAKNELAQTEYLVELNQIQKAERMASEQKKEVDSQSTDIADNS